MNNPEINNKKLSGLSPQESLGAVEGGAKPLVWLKNKIDTNLPCLEFETNMISTDNQDIVTRMFKVKNYVYYRADQKTNAEKIKNLVIQMNNTQTDNLEVGDRWIHRPPSSEYHREVGKLLGYGEEEVEEFIGHI